MQEPRVKLILHTLTAAADKALQDRPLPPELTRRQFRRMQAAAKPGYDASTHTVTMSVSSDTPIARYGGYEVLSHAPGAIDTSRLEAGIPLLYNHDWDKLIGRSQGYSIADGKLNVTNKFATNDFAKEREQDVADNILVDVSIGYQNLKVDITEDKNGVRTYNVTSWLCYENSLVTVPADFSVGVNRAAGDEPVEVEVTFRKLEADDDDDSEDDDEDEDDEERNKRTAEAAAAAPTPESSTTQPAQKRTLPAMDEPTVPAVATRDLAAEQKTRVSELNALRSAHPNHYTPDQFAADVANGTSARDAKDSIATRIISGAQQTNVVSPADSQLSRMSPKEQQTYSRSAAIRASVNQFRAGTFDDAGARFAVEVSDSIRKEASERGIAGLGSGILTPGVNNARFAAMELQQRTVASGGPQGAATNVTNVIVPPIDILRARSVCMRLGARMMPGLHGTPQFTVQNATATGNWMSEGQAGSNSDLGLGDFTMTPHRLTMINSYYRDFLALSAVAIDPLMSADRSASMALQIDYAVFAGSGIAPVPLGLMNRTGLGVQLSGATRSNAGVYTAGAGGVPPTFVDLNGMEAAIATSNADIGTMGWATTPRVRAAMRSILKFPGVNGSDPIMPDSKVDDSGVQEGPLGYNLVASTNVPTNYTANSVNNLHPLVLGVWDQIMIGDWDLNELITDNITGAASAKYIVTEHTYLDTAVRHLECFQAMFVLPS